MKEALFIFIPTLFVSMFIDVREVAFLIYILLIFDNAFAIINAFLFRTQKKWFCYKKIRKTLNKLLSYSVTIIVAWIVDYLLIFDFKVLKVVTSYMVIYEALSILTHLGKLTGVTLFSHIIDFIKSKFDIKKLIKNEKQTNN